MIDPRLKRDRLAEKYVKKVFTPDMTWGEMAPIVNWAIEAFKNGWLTAAAEERALEEKAKESLSRRIFRKIYR